MSDIEKTVPGDPRETAAAREVTREPDRYATPPVDIYEEEGRLVVLADLPGVKREDLSVRVEQGVLTIEGRVETGRAGGYALCEFALVPFFRQFRIAEVIDPQKIRANLKNGVLRLDLFLAEAAKPRRIPVEG